MDIETVIERTCKILDGEIIRLQKLVDQLKQVDSLADKMAILDQEPNVQAFLESGLYPDLDGISLENKLVVKSIASIGQAERVFNRGLLSEEDQRIRLDTLIRTLIEVERFYKEMGGVVGYHLTMLRFLCKPINRFDVSSAVYHSPVGIDLTKSSEQVDEAIYCAIERMREVCEIYPVGGAADRLRLFDDELKVALPAAKLLFNGKSLLARLIEDAQAREYLYYKFYGKQLTIPIAMMTSHEKNNHQRILDIFENSFWFHRKKDSFFLFCQPLVPTLNQDGDWAMCGPMQLLLKPGGHGVIWKLARDEGVIEWLFKQGMTKAVVRQINNPVSSEDHGLLAFYGYGLKQQKKFGFASCSRQVQASEGTNVIVEERKQGGYEYRLTNIEYCDFVKYRMVDEPVHEGSLYSKYPSNTNVLFVDLPSILSALESCPIPGMLVNLKNISYRDDKNEIRQEPLARLESTMQNIADCFYLRSDENIHPSDLLDHSTYITFNERRKTISATKKEFVQGKDILETPEGCFWDMLHNAKELLTEFCAFSVPDVGPFSEHHPPFLFSYHPALGPLYSVIGQKLRHGKIMPGGECKLSLSECDWENVSIDGSLIVEAEQVMGHLEEGVIVYSDRVGRCTLKNVKIKNKGIDFEMKNVFWKQAIYRKESCRIVLEGSSEFYAEDVELEGDILIRVPDGFRIVAKQKADGIYFDQEPLKGWNWEYSFAENKKICLKKSS